jgi:hypothetical protein
MPLYFHGFGNRDPRWHAKCMSLSVCMAERLVYLRWGRIALHLASILRGGKLRWHLAGIARELKAR